MRLLIVSVLACGLCGCGSRATMREAPVNITGKVSQAGQPVSGVMLVFQPLGHGHMRELPVQRNGTFNGEFIAGEYAYFVAKPTIPASVEPPRNLAPKYFQADMSRTVAIEPGAQLAISLD
jgi:hypothetical protein